jgi:uncharacterized membrane protein YccF (DUF307 family)
MEADLKNNKTIILLKIAYILCGGFFLVITFYTAGQVLFTRLPSEMPGHFKWLFAGFAAVSFGEIVIKPEIKKRDKQ